MVKNPIEVYYLLYVQSMDQYVDVIYVTYA
jgi:hypothetical protein